MTMQHPPFTPAPVQDRGTPPGPVQALLLRLLNQYGLSQGQVERATKIPQTRVSRYARGHVPRGADDVFKLIALEAELEEKAKAKSQEATPAPAAG